MESQLTLTALQTNLFWEDKQKNLDQLRNQIAQLPQSDLIILPEMFTTGFTMRAKEFAESMEGPTVEWMRGEAKKNNAVIAGSTIITEDEKRYNRFLFVLPSGDVHYYDKRHTFTLAGEHEAYATGQNDGLVHYKGWKICLRVCYDLRFPVWARNTSDYDVLIYTANWPHKRIDAWDTLLKARAIENMSYCVGVNRIGTDGSDLYYPGHTAIFDYMGEKLGETKQEEQDYTSVQLNREKMLLAREKLNFLNDRDRFTIQS